MSRGCALSRENLIPFEIGAKLQTDAGTLLGTLFTVFIVTHSLFFTTSL